MCMILPRGWTCGPLTGAALNRWLWPVHSIVLKALTELSTFFRESSEDSIFIEKILKHASAVQAKQNSSQVSLFGEDSEVQIPDIPLPECVPWSKTTTTKIRKRCNGFLHLWPSP